VRGEIVNVELVDGDAFTDKWNAFVGQVQSGTYVHRYEWKAILENSYSLKTFYCMVKVDDKIVGIFPAVACPSFTGLSTKLVSLGFCNYGDILASDYLAVSRARDLAIKYLHSLGCKSVEVRSAEGAPSDSETVTMVRQIDQPLDAIWNSLTSSCRRKVRKAKKNGLTVSWGRGYVHDFYNIYSHNVGQLGTPTHGRVFFEQIMTQFREDAEILVVKLDGEVIGAMLIIRHCGIWAAPFIASIPEFNYLYTNMLLYWEAISAAARAGCRSLDFGRSKRGTGVYRFKSQWGCTPQPLQYRVFRECGSGGNTSLDFHESMLASGSAFIWCRLPLFIQRRLGPLIRKQLP
tara:strand:+ start:1598 stop:2638 length:1041 start_codon:yes stop_codon:yes gene_type:complete